jgi:hypothetical protein
MMIRVIQPHCLTRMKDEHPLQYVLFEMEREQLQHT